jgi:hypothetical protein
VGQQTLLVAAEQGEPGGPEQPLVVKRVGHRRRRCWPTCDYKKLEINYLKNKIKINKNKTQKF